MRHFRVFLALILSRPDYENLGSARLKMRGERMCLDIYLICTPFGVLGDCIWYKTRNLQLKAATPSGWNG